MLVAAVEKLFPITDAGMVVEGECDSVPMVCPTDAGFPLNWIAMPGDKIKYN